MGLGWLVGVAINLAGSILINLGTNVMKLGHNKRAAMPEPLSGSKTPVRKIREWQVGVALFSVGNVANFISFGYAAQSLLAAIGCIQFVSNVLFASLVLKEQVSKAVIIAISCIVGGCIVLVSFGSHTSHKYTYKDLLALYGEPAYVAYLVVAAAAVLAAYGGFWFGQKKVMSRGAPGAPIWSAALPILYCIFSAVIGTQSVLFSKTLAVLLRATASGDNQLGKWFIWVVLPAFLFTAVFWVTRLNKGLKMFPAMVIVPTLQICWTLFSILSGTLYFQEYQEMHVLHACMFALGVSIVFVGVFLLTKASTPGHTAPPGGGLTAKLAHAKIAYVRNSSGEEEQAWQGGIGTASKPAFDSELLLNSLGGAPVPDTPGSQAEPSFSLESPHLYPELGSQYDEDDDFYGVNDSQLLLGQGHAPAAKSGFSFGKALASLQLQQIWQGKSAAGRHSTPSGEAHSAATYSDSVMGKPASEGGVALSNISVLHLEAGGFARQRRPAAQRLRHGVSSLSHRVAADFSLDETAAAKLSLGLGDSSMPGISLFAMPMADFYGGSPIEAGVYAKRYGMLPDCSHGGALPAAFIHAQPHSEASLLGDNEQHSITNSDGSLEAGTAAAIHGLRKSYTGCRQQAESEMVQLGGAKGINPLANAIDMSPSTQAAGNKGPFDGLLINVEEAAKSLKQNIQEMRSNVKELTANIQTAMGRGGTSYERMQLRDSMFGAAPEVEEDDNNTEMPGDEVREFAVHEAAAAAQR